MATHAQIKYRGRVVYDGPVVPGTPTDPAWWTLPHRLWVRCTPSGRQYLVDWLTNLALVEARQAHQRWLDSRDDMTRVIDHTWDYVRDSVWDQVRTAVADDPFPGRA